MSERPPFAHLVPAVAVGAAYGLAALVWAVAGDALPGGRWLAVHLFTLGTLSNLILALTDHFARTLTKARGDGRHQLRLAVFNAGVALVVAGRLTGWAPALAVGAVVATAAVMWLYVVLRRMRTRALGARFVFVVRAYERACGAFLHGAVLGAVLGLGVLPGSWHLSARLAHLTVNVLGWAGLVLLATVVFFAPTILRVRIEPGADARAARATRHGATAVTVAMAALLLTAVGGPGGLALRLLAAAALAGFAAAVTAVCVPVLRAARRAGPSPHGWMIAAACAWFPVVAWAGVAAVGWDAARWRELLGLVLLVGVLGQAVIAALSYLLPMVAGAGSSARNELRQRLDRLAGPRVVALNIGVALLAAGVGATRLGGLDAGAVTTAGWLVLAAAVAATVAVAAAGLSGARRRRTA